MLLPVVPLDPSELVTVSEPPRSARMPVPMNLPA